MLIHNRLFRLLLLALCLAAAACGSEPLDLSGDWRGQWRLTGLELTPGSLDKTKARSQLENALTTKPDARAFRLHLKQRGTSLSGSVVIGRGRELFGVCNNLAGKLRQGSFQLSGWAKNHWGELFQVELAGRAEPDQFSGRMEIQVRPEDISRRVHMEISAQFDLVRGG